MSHKGNSPKAKGIHKFEHGMFLTCCLTFFPSRAVGSRPLSRKEIGSPARERLATTAFVFPHCRGPLSW